jgi:hypothetical protein
MQKPLHLEVASPQSPNPQQPSSVCCMRARRAFPEPLAPLQGACVLAPDAEGRMRRFVRSMAVVTSLDDLLTLLQRSGDGHILACKIKCTTHGPTCPRPKTTFLSTRNSRRSTHAYFFLLALLGRPDAITDDMVQHVRRQLRPTCDLGLRYHQSDFTNAPANTLDTCVTDGLLHASIPSTTSWSTPKPLSLSS